ELAAGGLDAGPALELSRNEHVLKGGQVRQQVEELEHETDAIATEAGEPRLPQTAEVGSAHDHAAGRRPVESRNEVEQGRFSAAGRPHDGAELTPVDAQRDAVDCAGDASLVNLRDVG